MRLAASASLFAIVFLAGSACRQDMHNQPRYKPLAASTFFEDGRSARPAVAGTVARGSDELRDDELYYSGKVGGVAADTYPFPVTASVLLRGQERYAIFCTPCHGATGAGDGMIVRRGYRRPASFSDDRLRQAPAGYFVDVIASGFGAMPDYAAQVRVRDRWAIAAYIRALQLSQRASIEDVPPEDRRLLDRPLAGSEASPLTEPRP